MIKCSKKALHTNNNPTGFSVFSSGKNNISHWFLHLATWFFKGRCAWRRAEKHWGMWVRRVGRQPSLCGKSTELQEHHGSPLSTDWWEAPSSWVNVSASSWRQEPEEESSAEKEKVAAANTTFSSLFLHGVNNESFEWGLDGSSWKDGAQGPKAEALLKCIGELLLTDIVNILFPLRQLLLWWDAPSRDKNPPQQLQRKITFIANQSGCFSLIEISAGRPKQPLCVATCVTSLILLLRNTHTHTHTNSVSWETLIRARGWSPCFNHFLPSTTGRCSAWIKKMYEPKHFPVCRCTFSRTVGWFVIPPREKSTERFLFPPFEAKSASKAKINTFDSRVKHSAQI